MKGSNKADRERLRIGSWFVRGRRLMLPSLLGTEIIRAILHTS